MFLVHGQFCAVQTVEYKLTKEWEANFSETVDFFDFLLIGEEDLRCWYLPGEVNIFPKFQLA